MYIVGVRPQSGDLLLNSGFHTDYVLKWRQSMGPPHKNV